jgi:lipid-A-disaccharide synthase
VTAAKCHAHFKKVSHDHAQSVMPNLLAGGAVFPEFIQGAATPDHIAGAALELLQNEPRRIQIKKRLAEVVSSLGGPGANTRAATAILSLFQ